MGGRLPGPAGGWGRVAFSAPGGGHGGRMRDAPLPQIAPEELARRLDQGERLQVFDVRAADRVAAGRIAFGQALDFHALPSSELYGLPSLGSLQLEAAGPVAVICNHGNSSKKST